jgi:hypothetical protein
MFIKEKKSYIVRVTEQFVTTIHRWNKILILKYLVGTLTAVLKNVME